MLSFIMLPLRTRFWDPGIVCVVMGCGGVNEDGGGMGGVKIKKLLVLKWRSSCAQVLQSLCNGASLQELRHRVQLCNRTALVNFLSH